MKYILLQEPVSLVNTFGQQLYKREQDESQEAQPASVTFKDFLYQRLADPKMSKSIDTLRATLRIKEAVDKAEKFVELNDDDWFLLSETVKEPTTPYNPTFGYCLLPFINAVVEATDKSP